ncbi:DNA methyltransferase [Streptococcus sp. FT1-55]|uniref:DNA methyltransferase n=1 Tax=Streptococcus sp. FT1-55 TaxID=3409805 RepID=UPI003BF5FF14
MKQELERLLAQNNTFTVEGVLNKNKLAELARQYNPELLNLLMSEKKISQHFFATLETGVLVFKKDVFLQFLNNKEFLPDSFTAYKTKIGLATGDKYLSENQEVVLNFPYKDCVLEGGQTKDDVKRQEIFFNETLAPTEINRLLDDKVLTNFKRYDETGEHEVEVLNDTDNLIIKGNNLIALHSLKKRFAGKIKLIYIDPPYNTGNDSFNYNDSFNHSTWLTFMKNRLETAKILLSNEGSIFVSLSDKEAHYCKVLMDEIFGEENYLNDIIWNSTKSVTNTALISVSHTHTLVYFKNKDWYVKNRTEFRIADDGAGFENPDNDPRGPWKSDPFQVGGWRPNQQYEIVNPNTGITYLPNKGSSWKNDFNKFQELLADNRIVFGVSGEAGPQRKRFLSEAVERGKVAKTIWEDAGTTTNGTQHLKQLFGEAVFSNPKPEQFIKKVIDLATNEGDIVLDYHLGSATTAAVAHKMNRQYIGIEQMDYIETVSVERLKKVIAGEQGGVSKDVNWSGGGSFVYAELKNDAQDFKNAIFEATTTEELLELFEFAKKSSFLSYRIDPKKLKKNEFEQLSLAEQKQILSGIIDNNNLYVNYADMDDSDYGISAEDKKLNHAFYGKEK